MKGQKGYVQVQGRAMKAAPAVGIFTRFKVLLLRWITLYHQRQELASLSDDALKDIGLSRADIQQEADRPFWNDPMKR